MDECIVTVGRPGTWKHMEEPCCTLGVLVEEVGHHVFELLSLLYRKEEVFAAACRTLFSCYVILLRNEIAVYTHEPCGSSHISILKGSHKVDYAVWLGLRSHIK